MEAAPTCNAFREMFKDTCYKDAPENYLFPALRTLLYHWLEVITICNSCREVFKKTCNIAVSKNTTYCCNEKSDSHLMKVLLILQRMYRPVSVQFSSVAQSCLTVCNPMNHSMPGLPAHHQLTEFTQTHAIESVMPSNHLILCCPLLLLPLIFPN